MYFSIGKAARFLNVSVSTLRRWEKNKKLIPKFKTPGHHRRYSINSLRKILGKKQGHVNKKVIGYARVSSHDQKEDLVRQSERLKKNLENQNYKIIKQINDFTDEQVLAFDVLEVITVFSARLYGKRSHQNKKAIA